MKSASSCSVTSWKRSSGGTSMVSTSERWIASPTCRRNAGRLPLTSEMRTSGMGFPLQRKVRRCGGEKAGERGVTVSASSRHQDIAKRGVPPKALVHRVHDGSASVEGDRRLAEGLDHRDAIPPELVAAPRAENHVACPVLLGDPDAAGVCADGAAGAVHDPQGLSPLEAQQAGIQFNLHGALLAFGMRRMHPWHARLKR